MRKLLSSGRAALMVYVFVVYRMRSYSRPHQGKMEVRSEEGFVLNDLDLEAERLGRRPLVGAMLSVQGRMAGFKERVRAYYFEVFLSLH